MSNLNLQAGLVAVAAIFAGGAQADVLLVVDLSVVNQITISATNGLAANTATGSDGIGVYFDNFYGAAGTSLAEVLVSGDITSAENTPDLTPNLFRGGAGSDTGLNLWSFTDDTDTTFTAGSLAFTGSATWDLSATEYAEMLAGNSSGDLYFPADTFDDVPGATFLGTYSVVVPTPGALSLLGVGLGAGVMRRRR